MITLDDWQIPMAHAGRSLVFDEWIADIGRRGPALDDYVALMEARYYETLFSSPLWGVLFDFDTETQDATN